MKETKTISFENIPYEFFRNLQYLEPEEAGELLQSVVLSVEAAAENTPDEDMPDIQAAFPAVDIADVYHCALFPLYMTLRTYACIHEGTEERHPFR